MRLLTCCFIFAVAMAAVGARIESPKGREFRQSLGPTRLTDPLVRNTNTVYRLKLAWDYPLGELVNITNFHLYVGQSPGTYTISEWAGTNWNGTNFVYTFTRTNWTERMDRHWLVVTAADHDGIESSPSNEVHWPLFGDTHYTLHWTVPHALVNIYATTNLALPKSQWTLIATVNNTNQWSDRMLTYQFFFIMTDSPEMLWVTTFNPNP